jgi:DNA-binding CsgD family transcriptional regulator
MSGTRRAVTAVDEARVRFAHRAWGDAYAAWRAAERDAALDAADLERLAIAAYLTGRDKEAFEAWAGAHEAFVRTGDSVSAVRCAFWLGCVLLLGGQQAPAHGWFGRAQHLVDHQTSGPVAAAYLDLATGLVTLFSGDAASARSLLEAAARVGLGHGDADLAALGQLGSGQALIMLGRPREGVARLDEAMACISAGAVSAVATGLIYCALIDACQELFDLRRAQEWTALLGDWCDAQPDLVPYRGQCLIHRAQLMRFNGAWGDALAEAERASLRLSEPEHPALGAALYEEAELHRLRGEFRAADDAYRRASAAGHGAQPGLALLRLAQGRVAAAAATVERCLAEPQFPATRARLLSAHVEIRLVDGDPATARSAAEELVDLAAELGSPPMLAAMADDALGAVLLAEGDPHSALGALRRAWTSWQEVDAPYESARTRLQIGLACRGMGDEETAEMEFDAAGRAFARLGAGPDRVRADALLTRRSPAPGGLTSRELEVLALVANGSTNRAIAAELTISEKTVARHLSNVFTKLGVSSRAAATAFAYEHNLV